MDVESDLSPFFGSQERSKGSELLRKDMVVISSASDTHVRAFVKGSSAAKVSLTADEVDAPVFSSNCSCPQSRKGSLCRHVWAVLLKLQDKEADFLNGKAEIAEPGAQISAAEVARVAKQQEYKEQQRLKNKERNKQIKQQKKNSERGPALTYPAPVQDSLDYFSANGFTFTELELPALQNARKLLARVFHPDKGGTHEEVLELNAHYETLEDYIKS